jgi:hypothetical protein
MRYAGFDPLYFSHPSCAGFEPLYFSQPSCAGFDPRIHRPLQKSFSARSMGCRVKPGNDAFETRSSPAITGRAKPSYAAACSRG